MIYASHQDTLSEVVLTWLLRSSTNNQNHNYHDVSNLESIANISSTMKHILKNAKI